MRFSIIVPSYNQAAFLPACLESVLSQRSVDVEVLVYDGGSTDGSRPIIEEHADRLTFWQSQPDGGQAAALKAGFERATGDVFGWLNSDDLLLPGALARVAALLEDQPDTALAYGDAIWIDAAGKVLRPKREIAFDWAVFAYGYCFLAQPACFFPRAAYEAVGGIDAGFETCMDYDLWHRLARHGPVRHLPAFLAGVREHADTKTRRMPERFRSEEDLLRQRYLACSRLGFRLRHVWQRMRRVWLRVWQGGYRGLTEEEAGLVREG